MKIKIIPKTRKEKKNRAMNTLFESSKAIINQQILTVCSRRCRRHLLQQNKIRIFFHAEKKLLISNQREREKEKK